MSEFPEYLAWLSKSLMLMISNQSQDKPKILEEVRFDQDKLRKFLKTKSPFLYLTSEERENLISTSKILQITGSHLKIIKSGESNNYSPILILEGCVIANDHSTSFIEKLNPGDSFGFDSCLFKSSSYTITTDSDFCVIMAFSTDVVLELIKKEKQFSSIIGRNLVYKQGVFQSIEKFLMYVDDAREGGSINLRKLVRIYKKIESALHPYLKSKTLDISAWKYALERLPDSITETFVFNLATNLSDLYINDSFITEILSKSRKRTVLKSLSGKNLIVLRETETDLDDFLSNLCIHYIESNKLRKKLAKPGILQSLTNAKSLELLELTQEEKEGIWSIWAEKSPQVIRNLILHHEDYLISVNSSNINLRSAASEKWTEVVWKACQEALGTDESACDAVRNGLIVDVVQGSTKTVLNMISPYFRLNEKKILDWFASSGIKLKTKEFFEETDRLYAASFYYFKAFPSELQVKKQMDKESGIVSVENTEMTGVKVYIANLSRLSLPNLEAKCKNHLLINIGYAFGRQGYDIIKCFCLLLGSSIDSFAFIGKAGGLAGQRKEIMLSTKFYNMTTKEITTVNPKGLDIKTFENLGLVVHKGPMLTVPGTILQNHKVLKYYKHIESCVGLEMEGCFYAQGIKESIEMSLINPKIPTRFLYYISDLPLDPNSNLAQEGENVSWDEGVPTMNAITSYCLKLCSKKKNFKSVDRITGFVSRHKKFAFVQKYWDIAQAILDAGVPVIALVNLTEEIPKLTGDFVTIDYQEQSEFLFKIEKVASAFEYSNKVAYAVFECPGEDLFVDKKHASIKDLMQNAQVFFQKSEFMVMNENAKFMVGLEKGSNLKVEGACCLFQKDGEKYVISIDGNKKIIDVGDIVRMLLS